MCLHSRSRLHSGETVQVTFASGLRFRACVSGVIGPDEHPSDGHIAFLNLAPTQHQAETAGAIPAESWAFFDETMDGVDFGVDLRLARLKSCVLSHFTDPEVLEVAARQLGLTKRYVVALFRSKLGFRFSDWLVYVRMRRALWLLATQDRRVSEVTRQVGYRTLRAFERTFKQHAGLTPRQFKMLVRPL